MEGLPDCIAPVRALRWPMAQHPDSHELDDWPLYGPQNTAIANLVRGLAHTGGMRIVEIEAIIERALRDELAKGRGGGGNSARLTSNLDQT